MGGDETDSDSASDQEISDSEGGDSDKDADFKNVRLRLSGATSIVPCVIGRQLVSSLVPIIIGAR